MAAGIVSGKSGSLHPKCGSGDASQELLDVEATNISSQVFTARRRAFGFSSCLIPGAFTLSGLRLGSATALLLFEGLSGICVCCQILERAIEGLLTSKISRVYWKDEGIVCRRTGSLLIIYMHVLGVSAESRGGGAILLASDHAE